MDSIKLLSKPDLGKKLLSLPILPKRVILWKWQEALARNKLRTGEKSAFSVFAVINFARRGIFSPHFVSYFRRSLNFERKLFTWVFFMFAQWHIFTRFTWLSYRYINGIFSPEFFVATQEELKWSIVHALLVFHLCLRLRRPIWVLFQLQNTWKLQILSLSLTYLMKILKNTK